MFIINTTIRDIDTSELLPKASVVITDRQGNHVKVNGYSIGRLSDLDGNIIIPIANEDAYITVSYVGYQSITHPADDYRNDIIYLKRKTNTTKEVIIKAKRIQPKATEYKPVPVSKPKPKPQPKKKQKTPWLLIAGIGAVVIAIGGLIIYKLRKK